MDAMVAGRALSLGVAVVAAVGCIPVDLIGLAEQHKRAKKQLATPNRPLDLAAWEPVALQPPQRRPGQLVTLKVRVYADEEYRAANVRWQDRIRLLVSAASGYLEAGFGARLEIESMRPWKRQGAKDRTDQLLQALAAEDSGEGVDWVIGFVSPLGFVTTSIHEIGMAHLLGKHFVMRGIDDREEAAALAKNFRDLNARERDEFLTRRREHKELVVFLHEWLHNLGGIHHSDREILLHPSYAHQQQAIDAENAELVAIALEARLAARRTGDQPDYARLRAYVARVEPGTWYTAEREQLLALVPAPAAQAERPPGGGQAGRSSGGGRPSPPASPPVTSATLSNPRAPVPAGLMPREQPGSSSARTEAPAGLEGLRRAVDEGQWEAAITGCLAARSPDGRESAAQLAELCARVGMIGVAEQRLAGGGAGSPHEGAVREAILNARALHGVPAGRRALGPDEEGGRARQWFAARAALDANDLDGADTALKPALKHFVDDPGLLALSCETIVRRTGTDEPRRGPCERAVKAWGEMPRALFWSALARANGGDRRLAISRLLKAKDLDPAFDGPWKVLADIYRFQGKRAELAALRSEYQVRFGKPLK